MTKHLRLVAPALAALLAACDGEGTPTEPGQGGSRTFSAQVTGDLESMLKGEALFGAVEDPEHGPVFAIEMSETEGGGVIQLVRLGGETPGPGNYPVADGLHGSPKTGEFIALLFDSENGEPTALFVARSGSVKVTGAGATLKGSFNLEAEGGLFSDPEQTLTIRVAGTFTAEPGTAAVIPVSSRLGT